MSELNEKDFPPLTAQAFLTEDERTIKRLSAELAAMRKQRDEARREVCEADAILGTTAADTANAVARLRGWDCFGQGGGA